MLMAAKGLTALVLLIHVYIVLLEMVLFRSRGRKVFRIEPELVERLAPMFSNQGLYNGFLVLALVLGFVYPDPMMAKGFAVYGLVCVAAAGIWGAITVMRRIFYIQTVPAALALAAIWAAG